MKMKIITSFDRIRSIAFFTIASVSRTRITNNFMNVFNGVTSPCVISFRYVLFDYLTMPVNLKFNLTYRLNPQVSGIRIVTVYRQSIFSK